MRAAAAPGTRADPAWAGRATGWARGAHNGPSGKGRTRPAPPPGLRAHAGRGVPGQGKFLSGARVKAPPEQSGGGSGTWGRPRAGRGRAHEVPARRRAARRGREPAGPQTLCAPGWEDGAGAGGGAAWMPPLLRVGFVNPRGQTTGGARNFPDYGRLSRPGPALAAAWNRLRSPAGWERGAGGPARLGGSGGGAAMFLRGGLHGGEGGGHGGDCAPPPIVPGLGLGPRAAGTAVAEPPPLWAGLGGGWGTQRRGGAPASPPRSGLGAAGRRAAAAGKRGGGGGCRVRQAPTLTHRPLAAAPGIAGPRAPLCDMCCRPGLHERGGHFAVPAAPALFSVPKRDEGRLELEKADLFL